MQGGRVEVEEEEVWKGRCDEVSRTEGFDIGRTLDVVAGGIGPNRGMARNVVVAGERRKEGRGKVWHAGDGSGSSSGSGR